MKKRRIVNRIMLWALGGSLALHLVAAPFVHRIPTVDAKERRFPHIHIIHLVPPKAPPTPKPLVKPRTVATRPQPRPAPAVRPPQTRSIIAGGPQEPSAPHTRGDTTGGDPQPVATGSPEPPAPTPTPRSLCSDPNTPAKSVDPITPPVPDDAAGASGTAQVQVTLSPTGSVEAASIYHTTGNMLLDRAAVRAARSSSYAPERRDCLPVRGTYLFTAEFQT